MTLPLKTSEEPSVRLSRVATSPEVTDSAVPIVHPLSTSMSRRICSRVWSSTEKMAAPIRSRTSASRGSIRARARLSLPALAVRRIFTSPAEARNAIEGLVEA